MFLCNDKFYENEADNDVFSSSFKCQIFIKAYANPSGFIRPPPPSYTPSLLNSLSPISLFLSHSPLIVWLTFPTLHFLPYISFLYFFSPSISTFLTFLSLSITVSLSHCISTMCFKYCGPHSQKYWYGNFICMFSWLAWFFTWRISLKMKARSLKTAWAYAWVGHKHVTGINTSMHMRVSAHAHWHTRATTFGTLCNTFASIYLFSFSSRGEFQQHFTHIFFFQKQILQLLSNYRSALWLFGKRISAKNTHVKCWWNWPQIFLASSLFVTI